jgi:ribosomal protein S18 acetylase RimI-like enzyme
VITVRAATRADLAAVVELLGALHDPPTALPDIAAWERMLEQDGRTVLLAELNGEPAGTADVSISPNITNGAKARAYVENVAVAVEYRRRGVGTALMHEVERRAREADCCKVTLMSADHRSGAHRFYEGSGYTRCAVGFKKSIEGS